jgi:hypothetical protein
MYIGMLLGAHPILHISRIRVKKHIHLGFYTRTGGCSCSSKSAPDDWQNFDRNMFEQRLNNKRFYN